MGSSLASWLYRHVSLIRLDVVSAGARPVVGVGGVAGTIEGGSGIEHAHDQHETENDHAEFAGRAREFCVECGLGLGFKYGGGGHRLLVERGRVKIAAKGGTIRGECYGDVKMGGR